MKGIGGSRLNDYNRATAPYFCVAEVFDGSIDKQLGFLKEADSLTYVFDFPGKFSAYNAAIREYNCVVVAYNAEFDFIALEAMAHDLGKKSFFTKSTQIWDLQNIAMWNICNSRNYEIFCDDYNFLTDGKNRKCSAEVVYRYITQEIDFEEAHTALADTEIEAMILFACLQRHKKLHTEFVGKCWTHPVWKTHCKK